MKSIFYLIILFSSFHCLAQPVVNNYNVLDIGSYYKSVYADNREVVKINPTGPNKSWDFSALKPNTIFSPVYTRIISRNQANRANLFPEANYFKVTIKYGTDSIYTFYRVTNNSMDYLGSYDNKTATTDKYANPSTCLVFPFYFDSTVIDQYETGAASLGTQTTRYLSYGSLKMPDTTYPDVVMIRSVNNPVGSTHTWYDASSGMPVIESVFTAGSLGASVWFVVNNESKAEVQASLDEAEWISGIRFNNPVQSLLQVSFESAASTVDYRLFDHTGRLLIEGMTTSPEDLSIDLSAHPAGMYVMQLSSDVGKAKTLKILKQ